MSSLSSSSKPEISNPNHVSPIDTAAEKLTEEVKGIGTGPIRLVFLEYDSLRFWDRKKAREAWGKVGWRVALRGR